MSIYPHWLCDHPSAIATCTDPLWIHILPAFTPANMDSLTVRPRFVCIESSRSLGCVFNENEVRLLLLLLLFLFDIHWRNLQLALFLSYLLSGNTPTSPHNNPHDQLERPFSTIGPVRCFFSFTLRTRATVSQLNEIYSRERAHFPGI